MKKKRLFALITSAFFILSACGTAAANQEDNSWSNVEKKKELVVATSGTLFPASYYNDQNELVGYDVDLAKEVAKRLNVKISFKEYNVDGQITSVSKENQILLRTILVSQKKEKKFSLSETFKYSFDSMIVRKKMIQESTHLKILKGKKQLANPILAICV